MGARSTAPLRRPQAFGLDHDPVLNGVHSNSIHLVPYRSEINTAASHATKILYSNRRRQNLCAAVRSAHANNAALKASAFILAAALAAAFVSLYREECRPNITHAWKAFFTSATSAWPSGRRMRNARPAPLAQLSNDSKCLRLDAVINRSSASFEAGGRPPAIRAKRALTIVGAEIFRRPWRLPSPKMRCLESRSPMPASVPLFFYPLFVAAFELVSR